MNTGEIITFSQYRSTKETLIFFANFARILQSFGTKNRTTASTRKIGTGT